jgi:hypothetical protein
MIILYRMCSRHEILLNFALSTNQSIMHMPSSGAIICHVSDKNNPFSNLPRFFRLWLSLSMIYTCVTSGAGTAHRSGAPEFTTGF